LQSTFALVNNYEYKAFMLLSCSIGSLFFFFTVLGEGIVWRAFCFNADMDTILTDIHILKFENPLENLQRKEI
jgi:hypothetical protein